MTKEEAKIVIGNIPIKPEVLDDCYSITEYQEAKTMAIKALEQHQSRCDSCIHSEEQDGSNCYECVKGMADNFEAQPCDDAISRADVKKYLSAPDANGNRVIYESDLDLLPPVTPQPRWIPCTERLPKNDEDVLVYYSQGVMEVCYYHIDDTFYPTEYADLNETGWFNKNDDALYFEPVAWMPLPQPYKEESEGNA